MIKRKWQRATLLSLGAVLWIVSLICAYFRFDWRFLSGFELFHHPVAGEPCAFAFDSTANTRLTAVYVSKGNRTIEGDSFPGFTVTSIGPAIFACSDGSWRVTDGAVLISRNGRVWVRVP